MPVIAGDLALCPVRAILSMTIALHEYGEGVVHHLYSVSESTDGYISGQGHAGFGPTRADPAPRR